MSRVPCASIVLLNPMFENLLVLFTTNCATVQQWLTFLGNSAFGETHAACCFACESNKKKIVHPTYDDFLGCRDFEEDEVDLSGSNFPKPVGVDYIFFDADRDCDVAKYLDDRVGCDGVYRSSWCSGLWGLVDSVECDRLVSESGWHYYWQIVGGARLC